MESLSKDPYLEHVLQEALDAELAALEQLAGSLIVGPQEYRDPAIWSADWRKTLPIGDPDRPTDPADFITWDDERTIATLDALAELNIPPRPDYLT